MGTARNRGDKTMCSLWFPFKLEKGGTNNANPSPESQLKPRGRVRHLQFEKVAEQPGMELSLGALLPGSKPEAGVWYILNLRAFSTRRLGAP